LVRSIAPWVLKVAAMPDGFGKGTMFGSTPASSAAAAVVASSAPASACTIDMRLQLRAMDLSLWV
jgi:hypothetical protein